MRTAEETAIQLFAVFNGANIEYAQNIFTNHMDIDERKQWLRLAEYGIDKHDEAVAHGMTLASATAIRQPSHKHCGEIRDAIITARDNKIWRKTK